MVGKKHDAVLGKGKRMVIVKIGFNLQEEVICKLQLKVKTRVGREDELHKGPVMKNGEHSRYWEEITVVS